MKRWMHGFFLWLALSLPTAGAQAADQAWIEGEHYERLPFAVQTVDADRIEVVEAFWYGCIHCYHFEPLLNDWETQLPDDVVMVRLPAVWNPVMRLHARAFYTAVALEVLPKVHHPFFEALHEANLRLGSEEALATFFEAQAGVDKADFQKTFRSFGVDSRVRLAESRLRSYKVRGTPSLIVNGKYLISASQAGGHEAMLDVADYLIDLERGGMNRLAKPAAEENADDNTN